MYPPGKTPSAPSDRYTRTDLLMTDIGVDRYSLPPEVALSIPQ